MSRVDGLPRWRRVRGWAVLGRSGDAVHAVVRRDRATDTWYARCWLLKVPNARGHLGPADLTVDGATYESAAKEAIVRLIVATRAVTPEASHGD